MSVDILEIAESSWHRWMSQYGGMKASGRETPEGVGGRERPPEEARREPGARYRHVA